MSLHHCAGLSREFPEDGPSPLSVKAENAGVYTEGIFLGRETKRRN